MSMGPLDMSGVIPIGLDMKNKPWPDHSNVNDPEWAEKNVSLDMNAWMQGSGFDGNMLMEDGFDSVRMPNN